MELFRQILSRMIIAALGCAIALSVAELGIRMISPQPTHPSLFAFDKELGPISVPNQQGRRTLPGVFDYTYTHDSDGLRVTGYTDREKAKFRLLLLGDSFTYGLGVSDQQTFAYLIEENLSTNHWPTTVINAGNLAKGTDYALKFFQIHGVQFGPDLTVLCFFSNDFYDNGKSQYYAVDEDGQVHVKRLSQPFYARKNFLTQSSVYNWLISWSHVANLLKQTTVKLLLRSGKTEKGTFSREIVHYPNQTKFSDENNKKATGIFIRHLKRAARDTGSDFMVFYIPRADEVAHYRESREISIDETAFNKLLNSQNDELFSLTPILAESPESIERLYYVEGHWTAVAHALAARFMSSHIKKRWTP